MSHRLLKFLGVGGAAFAVDAGVMAALIEVVGLPPIPARLIAFAVALAFSFALNRSVTFADRPQRGAGQFLLYATASVLAGGANLATFGLIVRLGPDAGYVPYVALPAGVLVGLVINLALYDRVVFRAAPASPQGRVRQEG